MPTRSMIDDHEIVQTIDLGDEFEPDHVTIETNPDGQRPYVAVPFSEDVTGYKELGPEYEATPEYIRRVTELADVDGEIQFIRYWADPLTDSDVLRDDIL